MTGFNGVDIHAHFYPQPYLDLVAGEGHLCGASCATTADGISTIEAGGMRAGPIGPEYSNLELRVAAMDAQGVRVQALSLTMPMLYWAGGGLEIKLAQAYNDGAAAAHDAYSDRFVGLAALPMQKPDLAARELERAAALPGIRGVYLGTRINDRELSDPAFFPVYERIEDLGLPIFLHPNNITDPKRLKQFYLGNLIGNPMDTAIAASHLIYGGVLDRFPKLDICLPHAGGAFPYLVGRINHGWEVRPECNHLEAGPVTYLRRFYYDTISHSAPALDYLIGLVGADRVMIGSDYCFDMGYERPVEVVTGHAGLSDDDRDNILGGNARRLLGL